MLTPNVWKELITLEWFHLKISPPRLDSVSRKEVGGIAETPLLTAIFSKQKDKKR